MPSSARPLAGQTFCPEASGELRSAQTDWERAIVLVGALQDLKERKQAQDQLHLAATVFAHAHESIMITSAEGVIIDVNEAFSCITGYSRDEVLGKNPRVLSSGRQSPEFYRGMWDNLIDKGHWHGEIWNRRKNGDIHAAMQTIFSVIDVQGLVTHYCSLISDISASKEYQNQLEHIAHFDALTNLPNRSLLVARLQVCLTHAQQHQKLLAVVYLDVDGFKCINDRHGHDAGDELLVVLAGRLKRVMRDGDTLARMGGDEFVAVLVDQEDAAACGRLLSSLLDIVAQPVQVGALTVQVSASLGVAFYPQPDEADADLLLRQADQAMYQAKLAGKNRYHVFDADQDRSVRGHHESVERIRQAMSAQEFVLYYQPKVNMRTGEVIGAEALIRWQHPQRGLLPPSVFLPVIEDHPLAIDLGEWVLNTALTQLEIWRAGGLSVPVSVNIGARQLQQPDFVDRLRSIMEGHLLVKPGYLCLEVLETSALEDLTHVSSVIEACRQLGVMFALDDFGTGYSSLTYLKRLPVTLLKIDQSFVRDMLDDPDDLAILEGVVGLASAFRRQVIAEGVETAEHGAMLLQLGCDLAQGYGIARPMPAQELPTWTAAWQPDPTWSDVPLMSRDDLPLLFATVEHRAWTQTVENYLLGQSSTLPQLDHHQCHFGTWLKGRGLARHGGHSCFADIDAMHRAAHVLAVHMCELKAQGQGQQALTQLVELHGLGTQLLVQLKGLMSQRQADLVSIGFKP